MLTAKSSSFLPRQQALYEAPSIGSYAALSTCEASIPCYTSSPVCWSRTYGWNSGLADALDLCYITPVYENYKIRNTKSMSGMACGGETCIRLGERIWRGDRRLVCTCCEDAVYSTMPAAACIGLTPP